MSAHLTSSLPPTPPLLPIALALNPAPRVAQAYAPEGDGELSAHEIMVAFRTLQKEKQAAEMGGIAIENFPPKVQDKLR